MVEQDVSTSDLTPNAVDFLTGNGVALANLAAWRAEYKVSILSNLDLFSAIEVEPDRPGIGSRSHSEVILKLALVAVIGVQMLLLMSLSVI
jgi:hypothetical protein